MDSYTEPHFASSALLTVDLLVDFLSDSSSGLPGTTEILPATRIVTDAFRRAGLPVIHVVRLYLPDESNVDLCPLVKNKALAAM